MLYNVSCIDNFTFVERKMTISYPTSSR